MPKKYSYVGPKNLLKNFSIFRTNIKSSSDVLAWIQTTQQTLDSNIIATYIIDANENLWITDRHYEHVMCAKGQDVFAAGEITFSVCREQVEIIYITNQSTGYCPQPQCWEIVAKVLSQTNIHHPTAFSRAFIFRCCSHCQQINIIKDDIYECDVCSQELK